jgi:tRNA A-37 threonylcarbamoyl transferase component Bud32
VGDRGYILATELIHGEVLSDDNASQELCHAALTALRTVHSMGVAHGDLRRSNLLVEGSKVWLIDFSHAVADADTTNMMKEEKLMLDLFKPGWQD